MLQKAAQENFIRETSVLLKSSTLPANKKSLKHSTEGSKDQTTNNANDSQIPYSFQNGRSRSESNLIDRTSSQVGHKRPFQVNIIKPTESEPHLQNNVSAKSNSNGSSNQQNRPIYDEVQPESRSSSNQSQEITDQTEDKKEQIKNINLHYRISSRKEKQLGGGGQERRTQEEKHRRVLADISQLRKDRPKRTPSKPEHSNWVLRNSSGKVRQPTEENGQSLGKRSSPNADRVYSKANDNANIYDSIGDKGSRPNPRNETVSNGEVYHLRSRSDSEARQIDLALNELDRVLDENSFTSKSQCIFYCFNIKQKFFLIPQIIDFVSTCILCRSYVFHSFMNYRLNIDKKVFLYFFIIYQDQIKNLFSVLIC